LALAFVLGLSAWIEVVVDDAVVEVWVDIEVPTVREEAVEVVVEVDTAVPTALVVADIVAEVRVMAEVEVGKFERVARKFVGFGEGTSVAGGVPVGCLGFLGLVYPQGTFLQVPSFLLHSFFCFQEERQIKRPPKTPLWLQKDLLIHET
jgi:hypothetical protein